MMLSTSGLHILKTNPFWKKEDGPRPTDKKGRPLRPKVWGDTLEKFAIRVPQNAKPGQKMKVVAPNGATTTITMPDDVIGGMEMHVRLPRHPPAEPPPEPA